MKSIALLLVGTLTAAPAWAAPVGMAALVKGPVTMQFNGETKPLRLLQRVEPGATIKTGAGAEAVIVLFGGVGRFKIGAGKTATISETGVSSSTRLAALAGPSANAVKLLGNARVGAVMARYSASLQRLQPDSPGYQDIAAPQFSWNAIGADRTYTFTLLDPADNIVWSTQTNGLSATYPANGLPLQERRPYLWRLTAFATSGKPVETRSGLITFLSATDISTLSAQISELETEAKASADNTPSLMQAALFQEYGVYGRVLELFDNPKVQTAPGFAGLQADTFASLSPMVNILAGQSVKLIKK